MGIKIIKRYCADLSAWHSEQATSEAFVRQLFQTPEAVGQHPQIQAWRQAKTHYQILNQQQPSISAVVA